ncbi:MAG: hypothetical protein ACLRWH_08495 [Emergencia sp.]
MNTTEGGTSGANTCFQVGEWKESLWDEQNRQLWTLKKRKDAPGGKGNALLKACKNPIVSAYGDAVDGSEIDRLGGMAGTTLPKSAVHFWKRVEKRCESSQNAIRTGNHLSNAESAIQSMRSIHQLERNRRLTAG